MPSLITCLVWVNFNRVCGCVMLLPSFCFCHYALLLSHDPATFAKKFHVVVPSVVGGVTTSITQVPINRRLLHFGRDIYLEKVKGALLSHTVGDI